MNDHSRLSTAFSAKLINSNRYGIYSTGFYSIALILDFPIIQFPLKALRILFVPIDRV